MFGKTKSDKEKELERVAKTLDAFGEKITEEEDYTQYCELVVVEGRLQKEVMIEKMMAMTQFNAALRKGEKPVVPMPEMQFQNRSIRVEFGGEAGKAPTKEVAKKV